MTINIGDTVIYNAQPNSSAGVVLAKKPGGFQVGWGSYHSPDISSYTEDELTVIPKPKYKPGDILNNGSSRYLIQGIYWRDNQTFYEYIMLVEPVQQATAHVENTDWFKVIF